MSFFSPNVRKLSSLLPLCSRKNPFTLLVALDNTNDTVKAKGELFWDDGVSVGMNFLLQGYNGQLWATVGNCGQHHK